MKDGELAYTFVMIVLGAITIFSFYQIKESSVEALSITEKIEVLQTQRANDKHCQPQSFHYHECQRMYDNMVQDELTAQYEKN